MNTTYFDTFLRALERCGDQQGVLGAEGVIYPPEPDFGYENTPRNALTFGSMGVDGVHYAVLTVQGSVRDDSPVIQVSPMDFSNPYYVLSESFFKYLADGCGVTAMEMEEVFADERAGKQTLVPFLRGRFDQDRLWGQNRSARLDQYLTLIEPKSALL